MCPSAATGGHQGARASPFVPDGGGRAAYVVISGEGREMGREGGREGQDVTRYIHREEGSRKVRNVGW